MGRGRERGEEEGRRNPHLPDISTNLADLSQEQKPGHPLMEAESGLARKVMQMRDQSFEDVFHAVVLTERVDLVDILRDIVRRQVLHGRDFDLRWVHVDVCR